MSWHQKRITRQCYRLFVMLYISSTSVACIFIEETAFATCKTTNTKNVECVIFHARVFDCSSRCSRGSLRYIASIGTQIDASSKNEVNETTITGIKKGEYISRIFFMSSSFNMTNNEKTRINLVCKFMTAVIIFICAVLECHQIAGDDERSKLR